MSTILKALRRLEDEKTRDGSPRPLREEVASGPGEQAGRRWTSLIPVLALAVGAGLGASAWWLWPTELQRAVEPSASPTAAAAPEPLQPVAAAPAPQAAPPMDPVAQPAASVPADAGAALRQMTAELEDAQGPPEDAFASDVEVVERPAPAPRIEPVAPAPPVAPKAEVAAAEAPAPRVERPAPAPVLEAPRVAAPPTPPRVARAVDAKPPAVGREPETASRSMFEPKATVEPDLLPVPTPSAPARAASAPALAAAPSPAPAADVYVTRTQWHPEHARRSAEVSVAGQERSVKEGDVVGEFVVNEIKPSGVVLTRDGERIEQKIGKPPKEARSEP